MDSHKVHWIGMVAMQVDLAVGIGIVGIVGTVGIGIVFGAASVSPPPVVYQL